MESIIGVKCLYNKQGEIIGEKLICGKETKRTRRSDDQLLTDTITALYIKIQNKLNKITDERLIVEEIFDALQPLRQLEDKYRSIDNHGK